LEQLHCSKWSRTCTCGITSRTSKSCRIGGQSLPPFLLLEWWKWWSDHHVYLKKWHSKSGKLGLGLCPTSVPDAPIFAAIFPATLSPPLFPSHTSILLRLDTFQQGSQKYAETVHAWQGQISSWENRTKCKKEEYFIKAENLIKFDEIFSFCQSTKMLDSTIMVMKEGMMRCICDVHLQKEYFCLYHINYPVWKMSTQMDNQLPTSNFFINCKYYLSHEYISIEFFLLIVFERKI
jgi:hypothetical protein